MTASKTADSGTIRARAAWAPYRRTLAPSSLATVGELLSAWLADRLRLGQHTRDIETFGRAWLLHPARGLGDLELAALDVADVSAWLAYQRAEGLAWKTRDKHRALLSALLGFGVRIGAVAHNVARDLPAEERPGRGEDEGVDRAELELLNPSEIGAILVAAAAAGGRASSPLAWYLATSYAFGLRPAETAGLSAGDVVDRAGRIALIVRLQWDTKGGVLRPTKSRRPRTLPAPRWWVALHERAQEAFAARQGRPLEASEPLCWYPGPGRAVLRWNARTALRQFHRAQLRAGLVPPPTGPRRLHALRHSFVDALVAAGADIALISELTHPTSRRHRRHAFGRYVHEVWSRRVEAIDRLPAPVGLGHLFAQRELFGGPR